MTAIDLDRHELAAALLRRLRAPRGQDRRRGVDPKLASHDRRAIGEPLQMEPQQGPDSPTAKLLPQYIHSLVNTVSTADRDVPLPDWWTAQTEQLLMTMLLCCNRHNYSHSAGRGIRRRSTAMEVRRAEDYIEANWREPITLQDLAAVTGVSELGLFRSFKQYRDYSPLEFLAQMRSATRRIAPMTMPGRSTVFRSFARAIRRARAGSAVEGLFERYEVRAAGAARHRRYHRQQLPAHANRPELHRLWRRRPGAFSRQQICHAVVSHQG